MTNDLDLRARPGAGSVANDMAAAFAGAGFYIARNVFEVYELAPLKTIAGNAIEADALRYQAAGQPPPYGRVFTCLHYENAFLELFLNDRFYDLFCLPLQEPYPVLHVYTTSSVPPASVNVFNQLHVDSAYDYGDFVEGVGCIIMLDEFTVSNGATWVLPGSHCSPEQPSESVFREGAVRIIGAPGDVLFFHPRLWHRSGQNHTKEWRHSLSVGISRPYIRPHVDHYRLLESLGRLPRHPRLRQLVGVHTRPYDSLEDYYGRSPGRSHA